MSRDTQYVNGRDWKSYLEANSQFPDVRQNEVEHMLNTVDPQFGQSIVEVGTGNGVLTFPLATAVGETGRVMTYDATAENISAVKNQNTVLSLNIEANVQNLDYSLDEGDAVVDTVVSLAAFHHYDSNGVDGTGIQGRLRAMREFSRVLRPGGKLVIGDIANNSCSSQYFESIDTPELCPGGHPHSFLNKKLAEDLCAKANLRLQRFERKSVPWTFNNVDEAQEFINTIHGSTCSEEKSLEHAKKYLKLWKQNGKYYLEWALFYLVAVKN